MNKINQAIQKFKPNQDSENVPVLRFPELVGHQIDLSQIIGMVIYLGLPQA